MDKGVQGVAQVSHGPELGFAKGTGDRNDLQFFDFNEGQPKVKVP